MNTRITLKILLFVLSIIAPKVFAQESGVITGAVSDAKTKENLIGVNVQILGTTRGTVADINGQFRLDKLANGTYRLQFSLIG